MTAQKKAGKLNMVGNMSKPLQADPLDQLVYGPPATLAPAASAAAPAGGLNLASPDTPAVRRIVFTNQLTPAVYTQLRQYEYWGRKAIHEVLDEALTAFFADKPEASQPLPEKEKAKLRGKILE
jgi:hypothetical protein